MKLEIELTEEELEFINNHLSDFVELECVYKHFIGQVPIIVESLYKKGFLYMEYSPYDNDGWYHATHLWNYLNKIR